MAMLRRVFGYLSPYRARFGGALGLVVVLSLLELLKPWPITIVIDSVLGDRPLPFGITGGSREAILLGACVGLVLIHALLAAATLLSNRMTIAIGQRMVNDLRRDLYAHLHRLSLAFHNGRSVGDLLYRVTADTYAVQTLTMNCVFPALSSAGLLIGMAAVLVRLDWALTLLALAVCPALGLVIWLLNRRIAAAAAVARQEESVVYTVVQRAMSAVRLTQAFTREEDEHRRFMAVSTESLAATLRLFTLQTFYTGLVGVVIAAGTALVIWVAARHVMAGSLTIGGLVIFIAYLTSLYAPIHAILQTYGQVQGAIAGLRRVFEILDIERDLPDGSRVLTAVAARGELAWENVVFGYTPERPVLRGVNLRVKPGQTVAIVGATGAGKSTLVNLVLRFYDPQQGRVTLDGIDLRQFRLKSLRRRIAIVMQPPLVVPMSIHENIALTRPDAPLDEVITAARLACIHDSIVRLPKGYNTTVGEQGVTLSEGERQRLTIARAILRDAPILILDEPTSSVDAETEALLMRGLQALSAGRTTLIIAHRLSTIRRADLVVVLGDGRIVESGTFRELIARGGVLASLYRTQTSEPARVHV
jgi:ATP-binding cassette subfamily B protein